MKAGIVATLLIAAAALSLSATAQKVNKCADGSYSQSACAGGVALPSDTPTPAQIATARANAKRDAKAADAMETARREQEARAVAQPTVSVKTPPNAKLKRTSGKKKKADDLMAIVPGSGKKPTKKKKSSA
jgi:hypothetical protein